tara:strand:- start:55 stop:270 length:216 start_codon:yes stop_codon:yes gene_type:complete
LIKKKYYFFLKTPFIKKIPNKIIIIGDNHKKKVLELKRGLSKINSPYRFAKKFVISFSLFPSSNFFFYYHS